MKKLLFLIGCALVYFNWNSVVASVSPTKTSELAQSGTVVLYATSWCGYCRSARALLERKGIKYVEFDIEKSTEGAKLHKALGGGGVPVLEIGNEVIRGFNEKRILDAVKNRS